MYLIFHNKKIVYSFSGDLAKLNAEVKLTQLARKECGLLELYFIGNALESKLLGNYEL